MRRLRLGQAMRGARSLPAALLGAVVLFVLTSFALNHLITRHLLRAGLLDAPKLTLVRFAAAALMLLALVAARGDLREARPRRADAWTGLFLVVYGVTIAYGYRYIGAAAGTFVSNAAVVASMTTGGALLAGTRPKRRALLAALVALSGVGVLAYDRTEGTTLLGVLLLAATGLAWGAYSLAQRDGGRDPRAAALRTTRAFLVATPFLALLPLLDSATPWTLHGVLWAAFMGAIPTAVAYVAWAWTLQRLAPQQAAVYQLFIPVIAGAGGLLFLGEAITLRLLVAGALVLVGMWLATPREPIPAPKVGAVADDAPGRA